METRPKIPIERTDGDTMLETAAWFALLLLWGVAVYGYMRLPDVIPAHFDGAGRVDRYGGKWTILLLPAIGAALFAGLTILNRHPHFFNYPVAVTAENARSLYTTGTKMIRALKLAVMLIFLLIEAHIYMAAVGMAAGLSWWFFPLTVALLIVPTGFYIPRMFGPEKTQRYDPRNNQSKI